MASETTNKITLSRYGRAKSKYDRQFLVCVDWRSFYHAFTGSWYRTWWLSGVVTFLVLSGFW